MIILDGNFRRNCVPVLDFQPVLGTSPPAADLRDELVPGT